MTYSRPFTRLSEALQAIAPERVYERSMEGHAKSTQMSPADLVAYLLGWNELVLKWLARGASARSAVANATLVAG